MFCDEANELTEKFRNIFDSHEIGDLDKLKNDLNYLLRQTGTEYSKRLYNVVTQIQKSNLSA